MKPEHFLAWLAMADLEATGDATLCEVMNDMLEEAPENPGRIVDRFLDEVEEQLDAPSLCHATIRAWPERYSALLVSESGVRGAQMGADPAASNISEEPAASPTLARFEACLSELGQARNEESTRRAWLELEVLEREMVSTQAGFASDPAGTASAQAAAGERLLNEGFEHWLRAFDLAKVGEADQALSAAREGNRLFRAVADWGAELEERPEISSTGQGEA